MSPKQTYFGFTTAQQRKRLFEEWEASGSVTKACQRARVSRGVFYYWKARFDQDGYAGLEAFGSRIAHNLNRKEKGLEQRVIELRRKNPDWGKTRISQEMAKANNWVPLVSPNTVRRILVAAGLWSESEPGKKKHPENRSSNG